MFGFVDTNLELVIHDLVDGNSKHIEEYLRIYSDLFPQYVRYIPVMRRRAEMRADRHAIEKWHQWLLVVKGEAVGIVGFLFNRRRNVGILMDFAVYPKARKLQMQGDVRLPQFALNLSMKQLTEDARENKFSVPLCLAAEVEHPALLKKYEEYGYIEFPVEYFEPPTTPELEKLSDKIQRTSGILDFRKLHVGAFQIPGFPFDPKDNGIIRTVLSAFLEDHYQLPPTHWLVQKVNREIPV